MAIYTIQVIGKGYYYQYADNPKISSIYVVREMLGLRFRLAQEVAGRE